MGADVLRAPAENVYPSIIGVVLIAHDDVRREASLLLCPPQDFLNGICTPLWGQVAGNNVALGIKNRYPVRPLSLSSLPPLRWDTLVRREFLVYVPDLGELDLVASSDFLCRRTKSLRPAPHGGPQPGKLISGISHTAARLLKRPFPLFSGARKAFRPYR